MNLGHSTRLLGKRKLAILRVLDAIGEPATFEKVRCRGVNLREWGTNSLLGENLRALVADGLVDTSPPVRRGGIHVKQGRYLINDAGRAVVAEEAS